MPKVYYIIPSPTPSAIVVCCNDVRIQTAVRDFLEAECRLFDGDYVPMPVAGGPGRLLHPVVLNVDHRFMMSQILLHLEESPSIKLVICIGHEDCKWYGKMIACSKFWRGYLGASPDQVARNALCENVNPGVGRVREDLSKLGVGLSCYFGEFAGRPRGNEISEDLVRRLQKPSKGVGGFLFYVLGG